MRAKVTKGEVTGGQHFRSEADTIFGPEHYLVEGIVLMPEFDCELGPGQSTRPT